MNILHINASYKPAHIYGGPTMSVAKLCEQLIRIGNQVEVFTTTANGTEELAIERNIPQNVDGVKVRYFNRLTKDHSHFSPRLLLTLWNDVRTFDVVHIHAWWNLVSVLSCLIAITRNVPVIVSPRGTLSPYSFTNSNRIIKNILHTFISKPLLKRTHIHATSDREQKALQNLIESKSTFTIYNAVELPASLPMQIQKESIFKLLFLSRIDPKKGLELLFAALSTVSFPYYLTIAGNGEENYINSLKKLSRQHQIEAHIDWVGFKTDDKFELIARHHLLVLPSYDENFGNVVVESLSVGTAVLISKEVGLAKYVEENNLGWVCDTTTASIEDSLNRVYNSADRLTEVRKSAPLLVANDFNEKNLIIQYQEMYQLASLPQHD